MYMLGHIIKKWISFSSHTGPRYSRGFCWRDRVGERGFGPIVHLFVTIFLGDIPAILACVIESSLHAFTAIACVKNIHSFGWESQQSERLSNLAPITDKNCLIRAHPRLSEAKTWAICMCLKWLYGTLWWLSWLFIALWLFWTGLWALSSSKLFFRQKACKPGGWMPPQSLICWVDQEERVNLNLRWSDGCTWGRKSGRGGGLRGLSHGQLLLTS